MRSIHNNTKNPLSPKLVITSIGLLVLTACSDSMHATYFKESYSSNGERIYLTGQSNNGKQIRAVGGHYHTQMHGGGCATCHGGDREGGASMWLWFWKMAPALTPAALQGDHQDDGHSHPSYTRQSLKRSITEGINPEGEALDELMPRWRLADEDLEDLVSFLLSNEDSQ